MVLYAKICVKVGKNCRFSVFFGVFSVFFGVFLVFFFTDAPCSSRRIFGKPPGSLFVASAARMYLFVYGVFRPILRDFGVFWVSKWRPVSIFAL
jgi:hypothetical protein